ncbi:MAG: SpoIIIAH-like family protein [Clostridia bacterium]|nr:SpoIIIAH-like family protein [Clostridia bacterium]
MDTTKFLSKTKSFIRKINKRTWVTCSAILIVGIAVLLNVLFVPKNGDDNNNGVITPTINLNDISSSLDEMNDDANVTDVFAEMTLSRKKSRDEAIDVLKTLADSTGASEEDRISAKKSIEVIANCIENETNIESLIRAKGFMDCVAVISDNSASVIVKTPDPLAPNQIAQISEIVYEQSGVLPTELNIIEAE